MQAITIWKSLETDEKTKENFWSHHHIEDGHVMMAKVPAPFIDEDGKEFATQKGWKNMKWQTEHAFLDENNRIVRLKIDQSE